MLLFSYTTSKCIIALSIYTTEKEPHGRDKTYYFNEKETKIEITQKMKLIDTKCSLAPQFQHDAF